MSRSGVLNLLVAAAAVGSVGVWVVLDSTAGAPEFLFGTVVLLTLAAVLRLAVRAGRRAAEEHARATRLASLPEAEIARTAVAVERVRLASDVQAVVRSAAIAMGSAAEGAVRHWDDDPVPALRAIQDHGARAGLELRRLLGLLREVDDPASPETSSSGSGPRISRGDVLLAAGVTALAVAESIAFRAEVPLGAIVGALSLLLTAGAAATVVLWRVAPHLGAALCGLLFTVGIWTEPLASGFWLIATPGTLAWSAVSRRGLRGVPGLAVLCAGAAAQLAVRDPENLLIAVLILGIATAGGAAVRASERWQGAARKRADRRAAQLDEVAETAIRSERLAVARELHDVVSHAVGVMVMQAGAALATRDTDPVRSRRAVDVVRRTAAETLDELDRLVGVLDDDVLGAPLTGSDGHDVPALVERLRGALTVRLEIEGELSGEVGAVVYRVVQESLTNVIRHAPGAGAVVRVRASASGVEVEVVDDGPGVGSSPRRGYGLIGIDERVCRRGGEFTAGAGPDGRGFRVHARVPALAARPV